MNDTIGGDTVSALGDASMNNVGHVAFQVVLDGTDTILRWGGSLPYVDVVKEGDEWKLGEAYSGGEAHHAHSRFTDTFASVSEPRINDNDQVSYYAQTLPLTLDSPNPQTYNTCACLMFRAFHGRGYST